MTSLAAPRFDHLLALTDRRGTFEHARFSEPRPEHGYCTDDMARVLVVATREPRPTREVHDLAELSLRFLRDAQGSGGDYRNRMNQHGRWQDKPTLDDCWGRSVWALGTAASHAGDSRLRQLAMIDFERAARRRSTWPRAMAFAALGAAELLKVAPNHREARALLADAADEMPESPGDAVWSWPEPKLTYANAVLPEAMIAAGSLLERPDVLRQGLDLLGWLLDHETFDGHLSVTPVGGSGPGTVLPAFDQQPIEVAALADACARAAGAGGNDDRWARGIAMSVAWFLGENDGAQSMWDADTGAGFDGLQAIGKNLNQGAESTLAALATMQHARRLTAVEL